jgi:hypothetical protein
VTLNLVLWLVGAAMVGLGAWRFRRPYARLAELDRLAENARRYESWRGNRSPDSDGPSGADVMREMMRRMVIVWGAVVVVGAVLIVAGFAIR